MPKCRSRKSNSRCFGNGCTTHFVSFANGQGSGLQISFLVPQLKLGVDWNGDAGLESEVDRGSKNEI